MSQFEIPLARVPQQAAVPIETVRAQQSAAAAFTLACAASGLEDKEIYLALGVDAGYWSNIKRGKATLQSDLISAFCSTVGNTVYLEWMAYQVGCTLVLIQTEAERRAEAEKARADALQLENQLMRQLLVGRFEAADDRKRGA